MSAPWDADEIAWTRECAAAGDTVEEIAEWSGRSVPDVQRQLRGLMRLTEREREAASLYAAGLTIREIGRAMKADSPRPDSLGFSYLSRLRDKGYPVASSLDRKIAQRIQGAAQ